MTRILDDVKLDFQDVLLVPKRSDLDSRAKVNLERELKLKYAKEPFKGVPVVVANMDHTGTIAMADALNSYKMCVALHKFYKVEELITYFNRVERNYKTFYTTGISDEDLAKFDQVWNSCEQDAEPSLVCVDVANGYSRKLAKFVAVLRERYPDICIMAGNVVTPDMTYDLIEHGADIVKVGIGPGSVCLTRKMTGVGYPQLSAVMECADAAHGIGGLICSDGGATSPGDIVKAFAGGADFVMCGGMFAGHDECEGEVVGELRDHEEFEYKTENVHNQLFEPSVYIRRALKSQAGTRRDVQTGIMNERTKEVTWQGRTPLSFFKETVNLKMKFHGMSSKEAMEQHYGGKADYRASEGKEVLIHYKGSVAFTVEEILGGIRSACTYTGAYKLKDLPKVATLVRVNRQLNTVYGDK